MPFFCCVVQFFYIVVGDADVYRYFCATLYAVFSSTDLSKNRNKFVMVVVESRGKCFIIILCFKMHK